MSEHPIQQPIRAIDYPDGSNSFGTWEVGCNCTRIEACTKSGLHADMPYIRVWADSRCVAEYCQHNIFAVYFGKVL